MKRSFKKTPIAAACILIIVIIAASAVPYPVRNESATSEIQRLLSDIIGRDVSIQGVSLSILTGPRIILSDVTIADDPRFPRDTFLTAEKMMVSLALGSFLAGAPVVDRVKISNGTLNIISDENGQWNIATLGADCSVDKPTITDGAASSGWCGLFFREMTYRVTEAVLYEMDVVVSSPTTESDTMTTIEMNDVTIRLENNEALSLFDFDPSTFVEGLPITGNVTVRTNSGTIAGHAYTDLTLSGSIERQILNIDRATASLFGGETALAGLWDFSETPWDLEVSVSAWDIMANKILGAITGDGQDFFGTISCEGRFTGIGGSFSEIAGNLFGEGVVRIEEGLIPAFNIRTELIALGLITNNSGMPHDLDTIYSAITGSFTLENGAFTTAALAITSPEWDALAEGTLELSGDLVFDGDIFLSDTVTMEIKPVYFPELLSDTTGKLTIPFYVTGSIDEPDFLLRPEFLTEKNAEDIFDDFQRQMEEKYKSGFSVRYDKISFPIKQ